MSLRRRAVRVAATCLTALWVAAPVHAVDAAPSPEAAAVRAQVEQEVLPALAARVQAADARARAMDAWFSGTLAAPSGALPELAGLSLLDPAVAWGALRALDLAAEQRAADRVAPVSTDLSNRDQARVRSARTAALDAEDAAAAKVRRFWLGLIAATDAAPGLRADAVARRLDTIHARAPTPKDIGPEGPPDATAEAAFARGKAEAALVTLQAAAVRAATIPGDPALATSVSADVARLSAWLELPSDELASPSNAVVDAADRLERVGAWSPVPTEGVLRRWTERERARIQRNLDAEVEALQQRLESDEEPIVTSELAQRQVERARVAATESQAAWAALGGELNRARVPEPGLEVSEALALQNAATRVRLADLEVQLAERSVERARQAEASGDTVTLTTDDDVARAKAEAEVAKAEADRAAEQDALDVDTELRQQIATYSNRRAEVLEQRKSREEVAEGRRSARTDALTEGRTNLAAALSLGPLDQDRQTRLDDVYGRSRDIVSDLRTDIDTLRTAERDLVTRVDNELDQLPNAEATLPSGMDSALVSRWQDELSRLREDLERDRETADRDFHKAMDLLTEAKSFRRTARGHASPDARARVQSKFIDELVHELGEVPAIVGRLIEDTISLVRHLPTLVLDLGAVAAFFRGSFELVVLVLLWGVARERSGQWLSTALSHLQAVRPGDLGIAARIHDWVGTRGVAGQWPALEAVAAPVLLFIVDGLAGYVVYTELPENWTTIRLIMFLWLARTAWRAGNGLVPLLLVVPDEVRPGLRRVSEVGRTRAMYTVQIILGWVLIDALLGRVALYLLDADRIHDVVSWAGSATGWIIAIGILHVWAPDLREAVAEDPDDAIGRVLARQSDSVLLQAPMGGLALGALLLRWASRAASGLLEQRSGLAWVRTAMALQSIKNTDDAPTRRIPPAVHAKLARFDPEAVSLDEEAALVRAAFEAWQEEGRRGMVAVTGQRGSGKSRLLLKVPGLIEPVADGMPIRTLLLDQDIFDPDDALAWLMRELTDQPMDRGMGPDDATRILETLPPTVFVIDDLHRCFLRAVGGFRGLRDVLTVMHAVSDQHFWICAFHGDNWAYLEGIGNAVNLGVFRERVQMRPLTASQMRDWLEAHTRAVGLEPQYDDLATEGWMGADPERTRERARNAFFRLLAEATRGNPRVALDTWCRSLRATEDPTTVAVVLFEQPAGGRLEEAGQHALFVLASLVVHDGLDVHHMGRVLNLDEGSCRATCRRLEGLGVLDSDDADEHFHITLPWSPVVHRHLRRKHLLYRE